MATATYSASMRSRKTNSSSNFKSSAASQEFYENTYNLVGIVHFSGMSLANKVITGVSLTVTSAKAGFGAGHTKTVYLCRSNYQEASASGVTGLNYAGAQLGTFTGSFYGNTTSYTFSGALLTNVAAYIAAGNNTFCIYNPSPTASGYGYSGNYLQWESATLTVTYEEAASVPSMSATTITMGNAVTIYTNRASTAATHTIRYSYFTANATIATNVGASCTWTPPVSLAAQTPSATSGWGTILCDTYVGGVLVATNTCTFTLNVPTSVVPTISTLSFSEYVSGIAAQFGGYVQNVSRLSVSISASGAQSSTISSYRTTVNGTTHSGSSFTTDVLKTSGSNTISVTVTDSRGRTATKSSTFTVLAYQKPSITKFSAERCNAAGTAAQRDGTKVRVTLAGSASALSNRNTLTCKVYYKLTSSSAWTQATTVTHSNYAVSSTNLLLSPTFNVLNSYDLKVQLVDYFNTVEQSVSIGTKQVMMDFYRDGTAIAFGKVAETTGNVEFGWPLVLTSALGIAYGGTGATTAEGARTALGAAAVSHAHAISDTTGTLPLERGGTGATTAAGARSALGITLANLGAAASSHNHSAGNITSGTLLAARLPFKIAYGSTNVSGSTAATLDYSSAGFTSVPCVVVTYSTTGTNWSGDNGALKVYAKTTSSATVIVGGSFNTSRSIDWLAVGP